MTIIDGAAEYAKEMHDASGKLRKNTDEPYFIHPERVATRLMKLLSPGVKSGQLSSEDFNDIISAAYLHDVVEDCDVSLQEINERFGETIAGYVAELTSDKDYIADQMVKKQIKKYEAKALYLTEKFNQMSPQARLVKLADREDNVEDLAQVISHNNDWVHEYSLETAYILDNIEVELQPVEARLVESIKEKIKPYLD
ncbi:MAG TPA: HD domain-containing protein [Candidatus Lokiarchaeia archaeon]|nr:HD domain-containing protein [Candidatus Lokiarchaeia archaeon]